ncbi:hypothetical protein BD560DRAFT_303897, partial [Blakeslea trispora]
DSLLERQAIRMHQYLGRLREKINQSMSIVEGDDLPTYVGLFGHQIEMAMRYWYRHLLPKEFQISLPLFEDTDDLEFFTALETECGQNPFPLIALLSLYNEYLIVAKSYIPKSPTDVKDDSEELISKLKDVISNKSTTEKTILDTKQYQWLKQFVEKIEHFRKYHQEFFSDEELEESSSEFITRLI